MRGEQGVVGALRERVLRTGGLDPRVLQTGFTLLLFVTLLASVPFSGRAALTDEVLAALVLSAAATLFVLAVTPLIRDHRPLIVAMPLVAYATIGISVLDPGAGTLPLVVLPSLTLARQLGRAAIPTIGVGTALLVALPTLLAHGTTNHTLREMLPVPVVAMVAGAAVVVWFEVAREARREAQDALAELELQRRTNEAFVATVDVGLLLLDDDGNELVSNPRMQEITRLKYPDGQDVQHVYAANGRTLLDGADVPKTRAARGEEFDDVRVWIGAPADRRALSVTARSVVDETGRRTGAALAYQDVTELMRASAVKDEFIGLVSHELRTPLTSIYGYVSLLQERDDLPPVAEKHLGVVARNTDRLQLLVRDLLDVTQTVGGGLRLDAEPCDLAEVVGNAVLSARPHAEEAGIALEAEIPGPVTAVVDRSRMAQVLDNLVSNAIKYTQPGGWARVLLDREDEHVVLRVRDSGIGIGEDDLPKVFGRFYRAAEVSERAIQGAGLGLAISRAIVEGHGGRIEVESRPGQGTEFRVLLPASV